MTLTLDYPGTFAQAIISPDITPGDRLLLKEGTFSADFVATLNGVEASPIIILPFASDTPVIDGSFYTRGQWQVIKSLEITDADFTDRENNIPIHDGMRLELSAANIRAENCVIHNCRQGILIDATTSGEIYGCVIFHNGWSEPDRGHGHGVYLSNNSDTPKKITDCVLYGQFGWGLHCYAEGNGSAELLRNIQVEGCTMFGNGGGNIIGGVGMGTTVRTSCLKSCYVYDDLQIGGVSTGSIGFTLQDCVIVGNLTMLYYAGTPTITGNKFFGNVTITNGDTGQVVDHEALFPDNEYLPTFPDAVYLRANTYDANRANLTIFNGSQAGTIEVDVSAIYANGTELSVHNVQDYFTDIQALTVTAGTITVDMQAINRSVAAPVGWSAPATTFPQFGAFVVTA